MGAIAGLTGLAGGQSGTGVAAPTGANIVQPTTAGQVQNAYTGNQNALASQQALLTALQQQNGLGNQSQVYNQLQGVANGTGPNPAQAQLAQATGTNVANQAALMAGQRGASSNVGLLARQAAQQGATTQQQAVGQAATLQANQSLNAINSAGTIANTQAANQIGATTANTQAQQSEQQNLLNALAGQNTANVAQQSNINSANAGLAQTTMQGQQGLIGGVLNGAGALAGSSGGASSTAAAGGARGGMVGYADGGDTVTTTPVAPVTAPVAGPQSSFGQFLAGWSGSAKPQSQQPQAQQSTPTTGSGALQQGASNLVQGLGKSNNGGNPNADSSVDVTSTADADDFAQGGMTHDYRSGGNVKAKNAKEKAVVQGNSYSNDKIPAVLSEGEVVIPRSVMQSKDPIRGSADFVQKVLAKRKGKR